MTLLRSLIGFAIAIAAAAFAIANRQVVDVIYSPIHDPVSLPLYLIVLGLTALGFILGGIFVWMSMGHLRKTKRQQKKLIKTLEKELKAVNENGPIELSPSSEFFPALPDATNHGIKKA